MPEPFKCPNCEGENFKADYYNLVSQSVKLVIGEDNMAEPEPDDMSWGGDESAYDDACTDNDRLSCIDCGWERVLGYFTFVPLDRWDEVKVILDRK